MQRRARAHTVVRDRGADTRLIKMGKQRQHVQRPVARGIGRQIVRYQLLLIRVVIRGEQPADIGFLVGINVGGDTPAEVHLAAHAEPVRQATEGAQVGENGSRIQAGQLRVEMQPEGIMRRIGGATCTATLQHLQQGAQAPKVGHGDGRADHLKRDQLLRRQFEHVLAQRGQLIRGQIGPLAAAALEPRRVELHLEVTQLGVPHQAFVGGHRIQFAAKLLANQVRDLLQTDAGELQFHAHPARVTLCGVQPWRQRPERGAVVVVQCGFHVIQHLLAERDGAAATAAQSLSGRAAMSG